MLYSLVYCEKDEKRSHLQYILRAITELESYQHEQTLSGPKTINIYLNIPGIF